MKNKTIIISNRLPLNVSLTENHTLNLTPSVGGLATGLKSIHQEGNSVWVGWTGISSDELTQSLTQEIKVKANKEKCIPVPLTKKELDDFYFGFSNRVLWPLFHYFTEYTEFSESFWESYKKVNEKFAEVVIDQIEEGDKIWIHDYQLLLLPEMIKSKKPDVSIGFFLHIPFPSFEIFRLLPWRKEILLGMLGADLLGFHTYDYERHFISSVSRILRTEVAINSLQLEDRIIKVDSFPMGIDYEKFNQAALRQTSKSEEEKSEIQLRLEEHIKLSPDSKLIVSIDRLDYTKGIANRLKAFEFFLEKYPEFKEKVRLVMLAVPSRENVPQYQMLKREIDELVGRINGKFSTISWTPVWYFFRSLPFEELINLYTNSDIALLTPIRDGMNLVAKEYIASRTNQTGVLIISEMAGAAQEMNEALVINPNDFNQISDALKQAIEMPLDEQIARNKILQDRLKRYTIDKWAQEFMISLESLNKIKEEKYTRLLGNLNRERLLEKLKNAEKPIFFLDYDGTLADFNNDPLKAFPNRGVLESIQHLIDKKVEIVIISGRDKAFLESQFSDFQIGMVAEHGVWIKEKNGNWRITQNLQTNWKTSIRPILENYVDRTPGSFIEEKDFSLVWHYRKVDPGLGDIRTNELLSVLQSFLSNTKLMVMKGNKVLEIKDSNINKGNAALKFLRNTNDFIMAIGDDWTDEYMFRLLPASSFTLKVGSQETDAKFYVENTEKVSSLLYEMSILNLNKIS